MWFESCSSLQGLGLSRPFRVHGLAGWSDGSSDGLLLHADVNAAASSSSCTFNIACPRPCITLPTLRCSALLHLLLLPLVSKLLRLYKCVCFYLEKKGKKYILNVP